MKKFLPLVLFTLCFTGFLAVQVIWDKADLNAQQVSADKSKHALYEALFREGSYQTKDAGKIELKTLESPIVILNFWASWCLPCLKEMPSLVELQKKFGKKVTVIGINGDEDNAEKLLAKIASKYSLNFPNVLDTESAIANKFMVNNYPFSVVFHKGKVIHTSQKTFDFMDKAFIEQLEQLIVQK